LLQTVWSLNSDLSTGGCPVVSLQRLYKFLLPYAKQRWVTAALLLASSDILVCGDRGGTVHSFCFTEQVCQKNLSWCPRCNDVCGWVSVTLHQFV